MGKEIWKTARADKAAVIVDADDYFRLAREVMLKARRRIMLIGWDFDARIALAQDSDADDPAPTTVGELISWLVSQRPELEVFLLRWDLGAFKALFRGATALTVARWMAHPRIHVKLDAHHPPGASHHQKIVVVDDSFAFCGGIDITAERWDTREHRDDDPGRVLGRKVYKPWHDATTALEGPVAAVLGEHARDRWARATGVRLAAVRAKHTCWPDGLVPQFRGVDVSIARTAPKMAGQREIAEIEALYLRHIAAAKRFIYAESQYFASRKIAEAIARRLGEADGPEIVIVNPEGAEGWLEPVAMDTARARLVEALRRRDSHGRFAMYHPYTRNRTPIYVHAKLMIVDDLILRVGSSNMNNRSLRLDTECDVVVDCTLPGNDGCSEAIADIRESLMAEHLGVSKDAVRKAVARTGSLIAAIEALRWQGRRNARDRRRTVSPYVVPDLSAVEAWLADNEVLDPEGPDKTFEIIDRSGLFRRLRPAPVGPARGGPRHRGAR